MDPTTASNNVANHFSWNINDQLMYRHSLTTHENTVTDEVELFSKGLTDHPPHTVLVLHSALFHHSGPH